MKKYAINICVYLLIFCVSSLNAQITSVASGTWNSSTTWSGGVVPSAVTNVTIAAGNVVTLDIDSAKCNNLSLTGSGAKLRFSIDGTISGLTIFGNLTVGTGSLFRVESRSPVGAANSYLDHLLNIYGNITNSGTIDLRGGSTSGGSASGVLTTFLGTGNSTISLTSTNYQSSVEEFCGITINKTSGAKVILSSGNLFMTNASSVGPCILTFTNGKIETLGSSIWVALSTGSTAVTGASALSYVSGSFGRGMNTSQGTDKKFDIGDADGYRPIFVRSNTGGVASGHYVYTKLIKGVANNGSSTLSGGIDSVSRYHYYIVGYSKGGVAATADTMAFEQLTPSYRDDEGLAQNQTGVMVAYSKDSRATWLNAGPTNHVVDISNPPNILQSSTISPLIVLKNSETFNVALGFGIGSATGPIPDSTNAKYGPVLLHQYDFWKGSSASPSPLLIWIHGGGLTAGSKSDVSVNMVSSLLAKGFAVMSINYRLSPEVIVPNHYLDCARAIQYARLNAAKFNIDPDKIALGGSSAGGLTSFWLAYHDDLADPLNTDPVLRMSSRVKAIMCWSGQTSVDKRVVGDWIGPIVLDFSSYFSGTIFGLTPTTMDTPEAYAMFEMASPYNHVTAGDPATFMYYTYVDTPKTSSEAIHHVNFGIHLKSRLDSLGIPNSLLTPAYTSSVTDAGISFVLKYLSTPTDVKIGGDRITEKFKVYQNYPNPFNPSTKIRFEIGTSSKVSIMVYNVLGKLVSDLGVVDMNSGYHEVNFDGGKISSGMYICKISDGLNTKSIKMVILK